MKILVTGGAGFIGSHLVRQLLADHHEVVILDNLSTGALEHLPSQGYMLWQMDIRDEQVIAQIAAAHFDAIVHLAAQTMVDVSIRDPRLDASENITGLLNVLEAARQGQVKRLIFASTAAAYGDVLEQDLPVKEDHKLQPMSFYGLTKVTAEHYLELYQQLYGLDYVVLRFANVYGERQGDTGEGGVISIFAKRIAAAEGITIFGDGQQTRDFVYAGDIAEGICKALATDQVNTVYNISTQTETSLNALVDLFGQAAGTRIRPLYGPVRAGDIDRSMLCNEKAVSQLGWQPQMPLLEGLRRTYQYFKKHQ
ncbi:MAG: GDP-mannose 4,6-dehydratase [Selenomonas sp.]|jgi:UDP-glucose 4-epimerase|nr:GDP-mannose 4,6-dehydratase [Selenomonas sp.]